MGKLLVIKDADYSNVSVDQVNIIGEGTILPLQEVIPLYSITKNIKTDIIEQSSSQSFSICVYNVSDYVNGMLIYKNAIRNTETPTTKLVGACFFDENGDAINNTFCSHIYGSSTEGAQKKELLIPQNAVTFKLSWKNSLGTQSVVVNNV